MGPSIMRRSMHRLDRAYFKLDRAYFKLDRAYFKRMKVGGGGASSKSARFLEQFTNGTFLIKFTQYEKTGA